MVQIFARKAQNLPNPSRRCHTLSSTVLAAIEARRRARTSLQSFPLSSCHRRTPTLSHHRHPSPEEPPRRHEPQPSSIESFASLGVHPHDPLSVLPFSPLRLVHRSNLAAMLRRAFHSAMAPPGFPCPTAVGCARADLHRPSMDQ
jgi:hypothetical protein